MLAKMLAQTLGFVSRTFIRVGVQTTGQMADAGKNHVGALGRINGNTGPLREALGNVVARRAIQLVGGMNFNQDVEFPPQPSPDAGERERIVLAANMD